MRAEEEAQLTRVFGRSPFRARGAADPAVVDRLLAEGWAVLEGVLTPEQTAAAKAAMLSLLGPVGRNPFEGTRTQRAYSLLAKTREIDVLVEHPRVLEVVDAFLDNALLSAAIAVHLWPGEVPQLWHCDGEFYGVPRPRAPIGVSTIWALDDFTDDNGSTELVPRSHLWEDDRRPAPEVETTIIAPGSPEARFIRAVMPAGSVLVFWDSLYHRAGANRSGAARCGLTIQYCQGWARGIENMALAIPREIVARMSPRLQDLVGYSIHHAFIGYVDGRHPKKLLAGL